MFILLEHYEDEVFSFSVIYHSFEECEKQMREQQALFGRLFITATIVDISLNRTFMCTTISSSRPCTNILMEDPDQRGKWSCKEHGFQEIDFPLIRISAMDLGEFIFQKAIVSR